MTADGQIKSFFERWENLEGEKKQTADALKDLFGEAKGFGYDTKALRAAFRLKVKEDLDNPADAEFEAVVDTYLNAINAPSISTRDARMRVRENIEKFDPETGEILDRDARRRRRTSEAMDDNIALSAEMLADGLISEKAHAENIAISNGVARKYGAGPISDINPRLAKQVVDGMQTEAGRAALIAAVDIMIEREEAEGEFQAKASDDNGATVQVEKVPADSVTGDASRSSRRDDSPASNFTKTDAAISRPDATPDRPEIENRSDEGALQAPGSGEVQDEIAIHLPTNSPETANEVPAQDSEGTGLGESLSGKSDTARPASVDAQPNGRGSAGQAEESVVTVVGTESGTVANSKMHQRPSIDDEPSPEAGPQAEASPAGTGSGTLADREGRHEGEAASVVLPTRSDGGLNIVHKHTEIASASHGEAEAQAPMDVSLPVDDRSGDGANTGGDHEVTGSTPRAGQNDRASNNGEDRQAVLPNKTRVLRPHCQRPEMCGSGTRDHCWTCKKAMQESAA